MKSSKLPEGTTMFKKTIHVRRESVDPTKHTKKVKISIKKDIFLKKNREKPQIKKTLPSDESGAYSKTTDTSTTQENRYPATSGLNSFNRTLGRGQGRRHSHACVKKPLGVTNSSYFDNHRGSFYDKSGVQDSSSRDLNSTLRNHNHRMLDDIRNPAPKKVSMIYSKDEKVRVYKIN